MTQIAPSRTPQERAEAVATAAGLLRRGDIVALPTETVYGLAAYALNAEAVAKIFEAKERPRFDPLIVHLPGREWLDRITTIDSGARRLVEQLIERFWPGPLTMVLPRKEIVPDIVTAGLATVAVRISAHPVFSEILQAFGSPLAAPSANRFGRISPTTAQHVLDELEGRISLIVDGGSTAHGLESTIVAPRGGRIEILRRGPVTEEQLADFGNVVIAEASPHPEAPGQLPIHYAPSTPLLLVEDASAFILPANKRCGLLAWRPLGETKGFAEIRQLSPGQDLKESATNLFRYLRELDRSNLDLIVAEKMPESGLGAAIMDRLRRASRGAALSKSPH